MRLGISGSRSLKNTEFVEFLLKHSITYLPYTFNAVFTGGAVGVDTIAFEFFKREYVEPTVLYPDYDAYPSWRYYKALLDRNTRIVESSDYLIAIYKQSTEKVKGGTIDTSKKALQMNRSLVFVNVTRGTIEYYETYDSFIKNELI